MKVLVLLLLSCMSISYQITQAQPKANKNQAGIIYKLLSDSNGRKVRYNNLVKFNLTIKSDKDSLIFNSIDCTESFNVVIKKAHQSALTTIFMTLREGDSVLVHMPVDSLFKDTSLRLPRFLTKGGFVNLFIKIEKVQTKNEVLKQEKSLRHQEKELITKFLKKKDLDYKLTKSGLIFAPIQITEDQSVRPLDTILINYIAYTMGGSVFDTNIESEARTAGLYSSDENYIPMPIVVCESGQISPWDEGFLLMNKGSKSLLILPSSLAFGRMGLGCTIKPYSTIIVELELLEIRKGLKQNTPKSQYQQGVTPSSAKKKRTTFSSVLNEAGIFFMLLNKEKNSTDVNKNKPLTESLLTPKWFDLIMEKFLY